MIYNEPLYATVTVITSVLLKGIEYGGAINSHLTDILTHSIESHGDIRLRSHCMDALTNTEGNYLYKLLSLALDKPTDKLGCMDLYKYILKGVTVIERGEMNAKDTRDCVLMEIPIKVQMGKKHRRRTYPNVSAALSGLVCANIIRWVNIPLAERPSLLIKLLPNNVGKLFVEAATNSVIDLLKKVKLCNAVLTHEISKNKDVYIIKIKVDYERVSYPATYEITMRYKVSPLPAAPTVTLSGEYPSKLEKVKSLLLAAASKGATCYGCSAEIVTNILSISGFILGESTELSEEESICPICFCVVNKTSKKSFVKCGVCTAIMHRQCHAEYKYVNPEGTCPICRQ